MQYDFDELIPRRNTNSYKWDVSADSEFLPMWVADMDFKTAPAITAALTARAQQGIFGYTKVPDTYYQAVISWLARQHHFFIQQDWILYTTGVVPALSAIIRALTTPGDRIVVQTPVYNCFFSSIRNLGCELVAQPLVYRDGAYTMDFDALETLLQAQKMTLFLLCNPHNPVGRSWSRHELEQLGDLCLRYGVTVISDEIHSDLVFAPHHHTPFAAIKTSFLEHSVTCISPSKAFNLAGLQVANMIVADKIMRQKIDKALNIHEVCDLNAFAVDGLIAAYTDSDDWLMQLKQYLCENDRYFRQTLQQAFPQIAIPALEATYLTWIDCASLSCDASELSQYLSEHEKLRVTDGVLYGNAGRGFIRVNLACPRARLDVGVARLMRGFQALTGLAGQSLKISSDRLEQ